MEYIKLGRSDVEVSRICVGCMGFGNPNTGMHSWTLSEEDSTALIKQALDAGINFFDTAEGYQQGSSEEFVGRALGRLVRREEVRIATKFSPRSAEEKAAGVDGREHVRRHLDASLKRLGTDYVDLYICHVWDSGTPIEEIMAGLDDAYRAGKIRAAGVSNCYAWQLAKANFVAEKSGGVRFDSIQGHYNLLFREEEREMAPYCRAEGVSMTPYSPLASGRLVKAPGETSKRLEEDSFARSKYDATADMDAVIVARVAELAEKRGLTKVQVALGWLLSKVAAPVVGVTKPRHIEDAVSAVDVKLSAEDCAFLEEPYLPHKLVGAILGNRG